MTCLVEGFDAEALQFGIEAGLRRFDGSVEFGRGLAGADGDVDDRVDVDPHVLDDGELLRSVVG